MPFAGFFLQFDKPMMHEMDVRHNKNIGHFPKIHVHVSPREGAAGPHGQNGSNDKSEGKLTSLANVCLLQVFFCSSMSR